MMPSKWLRLFIQLQAGCLLASGPSAIAATLTGQDVPVPIPATSHRTADGCGAFDVLAGPGCVLHHGDSGLSFRIHSSGRSSINQLTISPEGLAVDNGPARVEADGVVAGAEIADLDADGWPEVYVYVTSAGSGSYGSLVAYAVNRGKSMSPIYLPPLSDVAGAAEGYMGHDEFAVIGNRLRRRFPVYLPGDVNSAPSGGTRELYYRLVPGEAGWQLVTGQPEK